MSFLEGHRITGKLCSRVCDKPSGCLNEGPQYAGKVTDAFRDRVLVQVTSCPDRPGAVGRERWVNPDKIQHLD
ncbi:hypothetical protein BI084_gp72 [Gordonia phage Terapin]|uniref:Uncharacterized protein n=5 Tax=Terapinvirus terapin TaxID=2734283 RepID=A0A345MBB1_9CAUD|nr:hypothetical protein BI084_gp72 [Gordonia phage Terapin]AVP43348.1 hypothetical protein PBI_DJOKOVIC_71 [Gordonia phage Djokovic]AXH67782.1 hypothetical protein SEA_BEYONCAGE_71 [Gordonia phage Beyoncage]QOC56216.1 hypothetical protein SEA_SIENNA_71 [Gordonia phage Sienna]QOC56641.1 hypothetical protein SEA_BITESIZE_71 [Gordonia phage BiteSize]QYW00873.1 hypothetical protein SEA_MADI_70 [Gordonia phage Madi]